MTLKQVIKEITSERKYYLKAEPPLKQSTASRIVVSIRRGTARTITIKEFVARFGFDYNHMERSITKTKKQPK